MVELTDSLTCLYTGRVEENADGEYVVRVPSTEIERGTIGVDETYRVALVHTGASKATPAESTGKRPHTPIEPTPDSHSGMDVNGGSSPPTPELKPDEPPVSEGEIREVTIETLGDKGDGIAKIERGYVVIVPDSELGDEVTVEITSVRENVSFATILE